MYIRSCRILNWGGAGIQIGIKGNMLTVIAPIEGTPADRAGIKAGDKIVKIDGKSTADMALIDVIVKLRGPKGTKVAITIVREGIAAPFDVVITREIIKIQSIKYRMLEGNIGYIGISQFQEQTGEYLKKAMKKLESDKMQSLIIDLRNNPGGLLTMAVEVSEQFVESGKLIVFIKDRKGEKDEFISRNTGKIKSYPMVVLVNEGSAAGAEIVAGALQDHKKAVIIGKQTSGSGIIHTVIPLDDGSAMRLATAKDYLPSGRAVHGGIVPDVEIEEQEGNDMPLVIAYSALKASKDISADVINQIIQKILNESGEEIRFHLFIP